MRLLLDEHYSRVIAEHLRRKGHDVVSVTERPDLAGLTDPDLFAAAQAERRAVVTENWADFQREIRAADDEGRTYYGVLFTSARRLPRSKRTVGLYVRVLDDFLRRHPGEGALLSGFRWLPD